MRYSADKIDPGYENWARDPARWRKTDILLDGAVIRRVVAVDDGEGLVIRNKTNEDGSLVVLGNEVAREELRGVVTYRLRV